MDIIYETEADSSLADRKALTKLVPVILDYLQTHCDFDLQKAVVEYEQHRRDYQKQKLETERKRLEEAKKQESTAEKMSYKLFFENFAPVVGDETVDWNYQFEVTNEKGKIEKTQSLRYSMLERHYLIVSMLALDEPRKYLEQLEREIEGIEFYVRRANGAFYDNPKFKVRRVRQK